MRRNETVILALWATHPTVMVTGGERVTRGKTARHMAHGKTNEDHVAEVAWQKTRRVMAAPCDASRITVITSTSKRPSRTAIRDGLLGGLPVGPEQGHPPF